MFITSRQRTKKDAHKNGHPFVFFSVTDIHMEGISVERLIVSVGGLVSATINATATGRTTTATAIDNSRAASDISDSRAGETFLHTSLKRLDTRCKIHSFLHDDNVF